MRSGAEKESKKAVFQAYVLLQQCGGAARAFRLARAAQLELQVLQLTLQAADAGRQLQARRDVGLVQRNLIWITSVSHGPSTRRPM
jgi:hypothetical protein